MILCPRLPSLGVLLEESNGALAVAEQAAGNFVVVDQFFAVVAYLLATTSQCERVIAIGTVRKYHRARGTTKRVVISIDNSLEGVSRPNGGSAAGHSGGALRYCQKNRADLSRIANLMILEGGHGGTPSPLLYAAL